MKRITHKPGFTLVESLVALLILVMVLSASLIATRVLTLQGQAVSNIVQMEALADESINNVRLYKDTFYQPGETGDFIESQLGIAHGDATHTHDRASIVGVFYAPTSTNDAKSSQEGGITKLSWCNQGAINCAGIVSPVGIKGVCGNPGSNCEVPTLLSSGGPGGELVAIRRNEPAGDVPCGASSANTFSNRNWNRPVVDLTSPLQSTPTKLISSPTCVFTDDANFDFYVRQIKVIRLSYCPIDFTGNPVGNSQNPCDAYANNKNKANSKLSNDTLLVSVKISNYRTGAELTRTGVVTNSSPDNIIVN